MTETIVAVSSPPGRGPRGVVRLSGPRAPALAAGVVDVFHEGRKAWRGELRLPGSLRLPAVIYSFPAPRSYTREDVVEIHVPGSPPLLRYLTDGLIARGARAASPGEFTMRAYLNGRIDLARAEAVQALIAARNEEEIRAARIQLDGGLSRLVEGAERALLDLCADVEAAIDFVDQDIEIIPEREIRIRLEEIAGEFDRLLAESAPPSETAPVVALYGLPNAGKSTLFNRLTGERAIVSPSAGTTRDVLEGTGRGGIRFRDAAGIHAASGVDGAAVDRARRAMEEADLVVFVVDAADPGAARDQFPISRPALLAVNKVDLVGGDRAEAVRRDFASVDGVCLSAETGEGVESLRSLIEDRVGRSGEAGAARFHVSVRQHAHLRRARGAVGEALRSPGAPVEVVAGELRAALDAVGAVTGRAVAEDLLDRIFSRFCLGK